MQPDRYQPPENQTPDPISPETLGQWSLACIEAAAAEQAIMVTWYDEVPWRL
jgi:hypothetical protein